MASFKEKETIAPRIAVYLGLSKTFPADDGNITGQSINPDIPATADVKSVERLRNQGVMVRYMLQKPVMLDVTLPAGDEIKMTEIKNDMNALAKNIVWLNLSGNHFTDSDLDFLHVLTNIEKLRLDDNPVSDSISNQLLALPHLQAVNLNGTNVTSRGLAKLQKNTAIKRIYSWKTAL